VAVNDVLSPATHLTREQMLANPFFVENLLLDLAAGKGLGLDDLPLAILGATVSNVGPLVITIVTPAPPVVVETVPSEQVPDPPATTVPPPPPPPPTAPECVTNGWTSRVGSAGQTFADEQACSVFALAGGTFATTGGGQFVVPRDATVTFSGASVSACNALRYGYELNLDPSTQKLVGTRTPGPPSCGGTFGGTTIGPLSTAVLLRVFLQDDNCLVGSSPAKFFSDGDHASLDPAHPLTVWIMDAGGDCSFVATPRPAEVDDLNLIVTILIG
ncbi:MAG: hypothetical protein ABWY77_02450, partial [Acidimicrobiia bacterium]